MFWLKYVKHSDEVLATGWPQFQPFASYTHNTSYVFLTVLLVEKNADVSTNQKGFSI